jgi:hypothetical protein
MNHEEHDKRAEETITRIVAEYGWYVALFEANAATPAFGYTIGLWQTFGHPEIISFGLSEDALHTILNNAGDLVRQGQKIELQKDNWAIFNKSPAQFQPVHKSNVPDYFGYGMWYNQYREFPAIQLFWTDTGFKYPWEESFDPELALVQPLLYRELDFKFFAARDTAAFAARQIFREDKPILLVERDEEGDWQFLTGEPVAQEDTMIVALEQVVKRDPTVNQLFDMNIGEMATREHVGGKWKRKPITVQEQ